MFYLYSRGGVLRQRPEVGGGRVSRPVCSGASVCRSGPGFRRRRRAPAAWACRRRRWGRAATRPGAAGWRPRPGTRAASPPAAAPSAPPSPCLAGILNLTQARYVLLTKSREHQKWSNSFRNKRDKILICEKKNTFIEQS